MTSSKIGIEVELTKQLNPRTRKEELIAIPKLDETGKEIPVWLHKLSRLQGTYIIGGTGTGKSGLLDNLIRQDTRQGIGVCVLDPHGDLIKNIIAQLHEDDLERVILIDAKDTKYQGTDYYPGLNIYHCADPTDDDLVTETYERIKHLFDVVTLENTEDKLGVRVSQGIRNSAYTFIDSSPVYGCTMLELPMLFTDTTVRANLIAHLQDDLIRKNYWEKRFNTWTSERQEDYGDMVCNKIEGYISNRKFQRIVGQRRNTLKFREVMDCRPGKILLVRLPGDSREMTELLGKIFIAQLLGAALSRENIPLEQRRQFNIYCDEFELYATEDFTRLLKECRKYGMAVTIAHQSRDFLDLRNKAASLQVANLIVFRVIHKDATELVGNFKLEPEEGEPLDRPIRTPINNPIHYWLSGKTHPNPVVNRFVDTYVQDLVEAIRQERIERKKEMMIAESEARAQERISERLGGSIVGLSYEWLDEEEGPFAKRLKALNTLLYEVMAQQHPHHYIPWEVIEASTARYSRLSTYLGLWGYGHEFYQYLDLLTAAQEESETLDDAEQDEHDKKKRLARLKANKLVLAAWKRKLLKDVDTMGKGIADVASIPQRIATIPERIQELQEQIPSRDDAIRKVVREYLIKYIHHEDMKGFLFQERERLTLAARQAFKAVEDEYEIKRGKRTRLKGDAGHLYTVEGEYAYWVKIGEEVPDDVLNKTYYCNDYFWGRHDEFHHYNTVNWKPFYSLKLSPAFPGRFIRIDLDSVKFIHTPAWYDKVDRHQLVWEIDEQALDAEVERRMQSKHPLDILDGAYPYSFHLYTHLPITEANIRQQKFSLFHADQLVTLLRVVCGDTAWWTYTKAEKKKKLLQDEINNLTQELAGLQAFEKPLKEVHAIEQEELRLAQGESGDDLELDVERFLGDGHAYEKRHFETWICDLWEVMQVLANEPITEPSGRYEERKGTGQSFADRAGQIANELSNLDDHIARVRIKGEDGRNVEYIIRTIKPERGLEGEALEKRIERIRNHMIAMKYCRAKTEIDEEIRKRHEALRQGTREPVTQKGGFKAKREEF